MAAVNLKTLGRSSLTGGLAQAWRILSRFILTPIIIDQIGMKGYGVWTLVFSLAAYVDMSNLSLGLAYTKFTAEYVRQRRFADLQRILGSGIALVTPIGIIGLAIAWFLGEPILSGLGVPAHLLSGANAALMIVIGMMLLRMTVGCRLEVLAGLQRIDLTFNLYVLTSIIEFAVSLPLLLLGYGLYGLAIGHATGQVANAVVAYFLVRKRLPQVRISPIHASREGIRKVLSVGGRFQLLALLNIGVQQGVKMLVSGMIGVDWLAIYELADKLHRLAKTASDAIVAPLMPAFADLYASGNKLRQRNLFFQGSRANAFFAWVAISFLGLLAPTVLFLWTGQEQEVAAWVLRMLLVGDALMILGATVSASLRAQGKTGLESTLALLSAGVFISCLIVLAPTLGFDGFVYSRLIGVTIASSWYVLAYLRTSKITVSEYLSQTRLPLLAVLLIGISLVALAVRTLVPFPTIPWVSPRWGAVIEVLLWGVAFAAAAGVGGWKFFLSPDDRVEIGRIAAGLYDRVRGREPPPPDVIVVTSAGAAAAEQLTAACTSLGRTHVMGMLATSELLASGVSPRLIVVLLSGDETPHRVWDWVLDRRPELRGRLAFVGDTPDPLYEREGIRYYDEVPTAEQLAEDWPAPAS